MVRYRRKSGVGMMSDNAPRSGKDTARVVWASSLGTVFEWYDFYLYGALATVISRQFFQA